MIDYSSEFLVLIAFLAFSSKRLMNYLHALQQEDYDNKRLFSWIIEYRVIDKRASASVCALALLSLMHIVDSIFLLNVLLFGVFIGVMSIEKDPRKDSKKALVLTARAKRILAPAVVMAGVFGAITAVIDIPMLWLLPVHLLPAFLILSNIMLQPREAKIQREFYIEAQNRLASIRPTIIGITGSYGKTSVKHILGHILKSAAPTLITPGSVNTLMGITRIIREQLQPNTRFFVVEMGAYGPGSIEKLCKLTPPDLGIISAIGHAHYERFKTLDTVAHAKYELAQATLAKGGTVIVHEKTLRFAHAREMRDRDPRNFIVIGDKPNPRDKNAEESFLGADDLIIKSIDQNPEGLKIKIKWGEKDYVIKAPIFGLHHGHNIALAFAAAMTLGLEANDIITALAKCPQITHRLEVKAYKDGSTIIDDAYNSNPSGFRSALELLVLLKPRGRKILVTPGIVELGAAHDEVHKTLGIYAAEVCDIALIVNPSRIPTFIEGFKSHPNAKDIMEFATFAQAEKWLVANKRDGDLILLENDLPDLYERVPKI